MRTVFVTWLLAAGCGEEPRKLSRTGLYDDIGRGTLAPGVIAFAPRFELWSDGATKQRWASIPDAVDVSDLDAFSFPRDTRFWKEFTRDGVRLETRMLHKVGDGAWTYTTYLWDEDQADATQVEEGVADARGTAHDIPSEEDCGECHDNVPDAVLGFSALQLSPIREELIAAGVIPDIPALGPPGDEVAVEALGVLHANCATCHNPWSEVDWLDLDLWLHADQLGAVEETATYRTTVGVEADEDEVDGLSTLVVPGLPEESLLVHRMAGRGVDWAMPPLASEQVDEDGTSAVSEWIRTLPVE